VTESLFDATHHSVDVAAVQFSHVHHVATVAIEACARVAW
jgi:hypothetical protein